MTSIAYRSGILATDSGEWVDRIAVGRMAKIQRAPDGYLSTACGSAFITAEFKRWVWEGRQERFQAPPHQDDDMFTGLYVSPSGEAWIVDMLGNETSCQNENFVAIGYGQEFMLGAMATGASAQRAVELACEFVAYAKPPVQVEKISKPQQPKTLIRPKLDSLKTVLPDPWNV